LDFVNNTRFLQIGVYDGDPNEAAALANAIAETYSDYRTEELRRLAAADGHIQYRSGDVAAPIVDRAVPGLRPVRPNRHLGESMVIVGVLLLVAGIVACNYSRIASYFLKMYSVNG